MQPEIVYLFLRSPNKSVIARVESVFTWLVSYERILKMYRLRLMFFGLLVFTAPALACDNPFICDSSSSEADSSASRNYDACGNPFGCDQQPSRPARAPATRTQSDPALIDLEEKAREHSDRIRCFGCPN